MRLYVPADHNALVKVTDEKNSPHYLIQTIRSFELNGVRVLSLSADTLGEARQSSLNLLPRYTLVVDEQEVGQINRLAGVWREVLFVSGLNWLLVGDITRNQYTGYHGSKKVLTVDTLATADDANYFIVDVTESNDEVPALLVAATLNRWRKVSIRAGVRGLFHQKKRAYDLGEDFTRFTNRQK